MKTRIDQFSVNEVNAHQKFTEKLQQYYWNEYSELTRQQNEHKEELTKALIYASCEYAFQRWQRGVKYKYSLHPLCTIGSTSFAGGRFNMGKDLNSMLPNFPALYLAEDKDTGLQEHLGQEPIASTVHLKPREIALTNPASETIVSVSGKLDQVIDLREPKNLTNLVKIIKEFKHSAALKKQARDIKLSSKIIKTEKELQSSLLNPTWNKKPIESDVPANSQIFGYLVYDAGIDGILYPSKLTGKSCLSIFPRNFSQSESFVCLDDEAPNKSVPTKIDSSNWRICELNAQEL